MKEMNLINSNQYWDRRFSEDWEQYLGPKQSRFFSRIAIDNIPAWLLEQIKRHRLTVADWGCAQGDGTDIWAGYVLPGNLFGIDFSNIAIAEASKRYPAITFECEDWLKPGAPKSRKYDIVFSSNTLEHFTNPYAVLDVLAEKVNKAIVLALPYREIDRIDEHFFSFLPENIPSVLTNGFTLVWSRVVDCRSVTETLWLGDQVLLVYAAPEWITELNLTLSDCQIEQVDTRADTLRQLSSLNQIIGDRDNQITSLNQIIGDRDNQIASLNQIIGERDGQIASLNQSISDWDSQVQALNQIIAAQDGQIASLNQIVNDHAAQITSLEEKERILQMLRASKSWRLTLPLRFLGRVSRHGLIDEDRRWLLSHAYSLYRRLPLPAPLKRQLARIYKMMPIASSAPSLSNSYVPGQNPYELICHLKPIQISVVDKDYAAYEKPPGFSCVTTVFNEADGIRSFLDSIKAQDCLPEELIVVDGGSNDGTCEIVRAYVDEFPCELKLIEAGRVNIALGRNIGIESSSHELIAIVDAGCELNQGFFRNLVGPLHEDESADLVSGCYEPKVKNAAAYRFIPDWSDASTWNWFLPSARSLCIKKSIWQKAGGFPDYLTLTGEDTQFDVSYRRHSERWVISKRAVVYWNAPSTDDAADKLSYRYGIGDGESGYGDFQFYPNVIEHLRNKKSAVPGPFLAGYLEGRQRRPEIEIERRGIKGVILMLSGVPFTDSGGGQRCSQLAMAFARQNYKVIFVNIYPSFEERRKLFFNIDYSLFEFYSLEDFSTEDFLDRYSRFQNLNVISILEFPHPRLLPLVGELKAGLRDNLTVIYDYIDNWRSTLGWDWYSEETEGTVIETSDHLVASAQTLKEDLYARTGRSIALIPNAVNQHLFNPHVMHERPGDLPAAKSIVMYIGALWGGWFDWDLVAHCADTIRDAQFVFVGGVDENKAKEFSKNRPNVHFLGLKPQTELPAYLAYATACHIPFTVDHITKYVNPLKVYEYLAMHKPVVVTDMPELKGISGVHVCSNTDEYVQAIANAITDSTVDKDTIDKFIQKNNWDSRVTALLGAL